MDNNKLFIVFSITVWVFLSIICSTLGAAASKVPITTVRISYPSSDVILFPNDELMLIARLGNDGEEAEYGRIRIELPAKDFRVISARGPRGGRGKIGETKDKVWGECHFLSPLKRGHQRVCLMKFKVKTMGSGTHLILGYGELLGKNEQFYPQVERGPEVNIPSPKPEVALQLSKGLTLSRGDEISLNFKLKNRGIKASGGGLEVELPAKNFEIIEVESNVLGSKTSIVSNQFGMVIGKCRFFFNIPLDREKQCEIKVKVKDKAEGSCKIKYRGWLENSFQNKFHSSGFREFFFSEKLPQPKLSASLITYEGNKVHVSVTLKNLGVTGKGGIQIKLPREKFEVLLVRSSEETKKLTDGGACYWSDVGPQESKVCLVTFKVKESEKIVIASPRYRGWLKKDKRIFYFPNSGFKTGLPIKVNRGDKKVSRYIKDRIINCFSK